jgi:hypothetical protein
MVSEFERDRTAQAIQQSTYACMPQDASTNRVDTDGLRCRSLAFPDTDWCDKNPSFLDFDLEFGQAVRHPRGGQLALAAI